jgi:molybdate transport system substrate-binding protein
MAGAPLDLFVSAAPAQMDRLEAAGKIVQNTRARLASNRLVLIAHRENAPSGELAALLVAPSVKHIAIGSPKMVPAGAYAQSALMHLGLWETVSPRLVNAANVRQVLDLVAKQEAELGFVYETDLRGRSDVANIADIPAEATGPILYPIAVLSSSTNLDLARDFVHFATSPAGQRILASYGFLPAP